MKKKFPYSTYIDLKTEQKDYRNLCRGKSKKYSVYTDWEEHIIECLSKIPDEKTLYNFKRYCMNHNRAFGKSPEMFVTYALFLLTLCIDKIFSMIPWWGWLIWGISVVLYQITTHKLIIKESYLFDDIIEIIEKMENKTSVSSEQEREEK